MPPQYSILLPNFEVMDLWNRGEGKPVDFSIEAYSFIPYKTNEIKTFNAVVAFELDKNNNSYRLTVEFLGEVLEPEEEVPAWVESEEAMSEGHPENERIEAATRAVFGLKDVWE